VTTCMECLDSGIPLVGVGYCECAAGAELLRADIEALDKHVATLPSDQVVNARTPSLYGAADDEFPHARRAA
jgi:hypothetical protein